MATITSTGIGSGLDVNSIVTSLMAIESRPLTMLQQAKSGLNTQLSAFGKLQSLTSAMRDAANSLSSVSLWNQTAASSSDSASVGVASASGAAVGSYAVNVQNLAVGQTVSSKMFASSNATLGAGTLTIELGSWDETDLWDDTDRLEGFKEKTGSTAVPITIESGDSLAAIRDKINAAGAGVTASIINDAGGARLALRSKDTGAENAFRITADSDDSPLAPLTYAAASLPPPSGGEEDHRMSRNQTAINANATINGIAITSASNKLEGVADGLTLSLLKTTTGNVDVGVKANDDAVKAAVTTFTTAFNALASYIRDQTKYDAGSKTGGTLQGDRTVGNLMSQLRGVLNEASSASATFSRLSDIGIVMKSDGTLETKGTQLDAAIANRAEMRKALATDGETTGASGFMDRFRDLGNAVLGTDGALTTRNSGLQQLITSNDKSQSAMQLRLTQTEKRLRAQYQTLDTNMAKLSGLSNYLSGQLAALAKNSG